MANTELSERIQWTILARHIPGKTGSHLRWRWNAIRPDRSMRPWTSEEDRYILDFQHENGNKWLECAKAVSSVQVPGDSTVDFDLGKPFSDTFSTPSFLSRSRSSQAGPTTTARTASASSRSSRVFARRRP